MVLRISQVGRIGKYDAYGATAFSGYGIFISGSCAYQIRSRVSIVRAANFFN